MTTYFIGRHAGTVVWIKRQPITIDVFKENFEPEDVKPGDTVIGTLPVHLAAAVCDKGATFVALTLDIPKEKRGLELTESEAIESNIRLCAFEVKSKPLDWCSAR